MSNRRASAFEVRRGAWRVLAAVVLLSALRGPLGAQSAAEMTQRVVAMQDSIRATQARLSAARVRHTLALDDSLVSEGVTVRFPSLAFTERDRAAIRDGIGEARRTLTEEYGEAAARLLDGDSWSVVLWSSRNGRYETASLMADPAVQSTQRRIVPVPLDAGYVASFVRDRAGQLLVSRDSTIAAFVGAGFSLAPQERAFYMALRHMATSRSSVARRCADGSVGACRTILDARASDQWFAPDDAKPGSDGRPFPRWVHGTLVQVALDLGGPRALESLSAPAPADDAVSRLAAAAGTTPDSLVMVWSARLREGTEANATPSLPLVASAAFWCGLFLLAATRRRPR